MIAAARSPEDIYLALFASLHSDPRFKVLLQRMEPTE
jgi:hypothetical protein